MEINEAGTRESSQTKDNQKWRGFVWKGWGLSGNDKFVMVQKLSFCMISGTNLEVGLAKAV